MYKTVLFDLDDTIFDFHKAEAIAVRKTLDEFGIDSCDENVALYSRINAEQWQLLESGRFTRQQILVRRFELLFEQLGVDAAVEKVNNTYKRHLSLGHYFMPGAEEMIKRLCRDYELYIVSNGNISVQEGRIKSSGIAKYFKEIFISEKVGYDKPSKKFFDICFEKIPGLIKEKTIIVGDSLTSDIKGGNNAGIEACWYNPRGRERIEGINVDYEIRHLKEIYEIL